MTAADDEVAQLRTAIRRAGWAVCDLTLKSDEQFALTAQCDLARMQRVTSYQDTGSILKRVAPGFTVGPSPNQVVMRATYRRGSLFVIVSQDLCLQDQRPGVLKFAEECDGLERDGWERDEPRRAADIAYGEHSTSMDGSDNE